MVSGSGKCYYGFYVWVERGGRGGKGVLEYFRYEGREGRGWGVKGEGG